MRLKHPKEKIDIVGWLRDFEHTLVNASRTGLRKMPVRLGLRKMNRERQLARDQINAAQPKGKLLKKSTEHEEKRLRGLDLVIELKTFLERFRRLNQFQQASR